MVHDQHVVGEALDDGEVVADQDEGAAGGEALLEQLEHLGLHGDVEGGGGLVGDEHRGVQGEGRSDQGPLPQTAGELAGQLPCTQLRLGHARRGEEVVHPSGPVAARHAVGPERLGDLGADPPQRVQGHQRVLEDVADPAPAQGAQLRLGGGEHVHPGVERGGGDLGGRSVQAQQGAGGDGLAGAGLAHDPEALPGAEGEGDVVDDLVPVEGDREVLHVQERRGEGAGGHRTAPASVARCRCRPSTVSDSVNSTIVMPGKKSIHQACWM